MERKDLLDTLRDGLVCALLVVLIVTGLQVQALLNDGFGIIGQTLGNVERASASVARSSEAFEKTAKA